MATPKHKNPCRRGHEIYNFGRPFLGYHSYILGLSDLCLGVEKEIFKAIKQFHCRCYIPNLDKIGPVVLEKEMLTHDGRDGRRGAIGRLSDSGDLTSFKHQNLPFWSY